MKLHHPPVENLASPWHAGELAMQQGVGVVAQMDRVGRSFVRDVMTDQQRDFYPLLPFVVIGSVDPRGDAWATMRAGAPGFLRPVDAATLRVATVHEPADPADAGLAGGMAVGLLGIDPMTRRRNRLNGSIGLSGDDGFDIEVEQSFGNCPRYIRQRSLRFVRDPAAGGGGIALESAAIDSRARAIVQAADTFYVASYVDRTSGIRQVDVSHRGGEPGFVRVGPDGKLTIPDFSGNRFFMTLGNFCLNPKAGLLFVDPATGDMLQMTGEARVLPDSPQTGSFDGAERLWTFMPHRVVYRPEALPLRWNR